MLYIITSNTKTNLFLTLTILAYTTPIHNLELEKKNQILIEQLEETVGIRS